MNDAANPRFHLALRPAAPAQMADALAEARDAGFDGIEFSLPSLNVVTGGRVLEAELNRLVTLLQSYTFTYSLHAPLSLNLMDTVHAEIHEAVAHACLDVAAAIGAKTLVVHPGWLTRHRLFTAHQELMQWEAQVLGDLAEAAGNCGVKVALENMPAVPESLTGDRTSYGLDPEMVANQVRTVGRPAMTCCLDVSHAAIAADYRGTDVYADIRAMAPDIGHIHLHDSFGVTPSLDVWMAEEAAAFGQGDVHLPLGWGNLDFTHLLDGLPVRPGTQVTLEIMPRFQRPDILADSLERAKRATAGLVPANA